MGINTKDMMERDGQDRYDRIVKDNIRYGGEDSSDIQDQIQQVSSQTFEISQWCKDSADFTIPTHGKFP